ncbi:Molybdopterin-guanine dinucleotide biosynthesis protein A [Brevibacterium siliguriense]|uniref:Molybdopterin-guanine dinucleotide biosynthesis protein A n=1 Tax=Brevibacterium siliguriense TaxID=1136497 RepID=A0A1H1P3J9_9MICO|nr:molybdenum cofactor guanylyltransferase [Brevibacterium siliguriense]SDS05828.1 Molybdopterin-guanine dinucleotide biosynthesis protein A [Brevibacterium siliguriense]
MSVTVMILSGGRSRRFGGVHKPGVRLGGQTVISRILGTVRQAVPEAEVWVAGATVGLTDAEAESVGSVREEPEFSGPLAGIEAASLAMGDSEVTVILAGDMPLVQPDHLRALIVASRESGLPASGVDDRGKLQFLCAAWPTVLLRRRLADIGQTQDRAVKLLFSGLEVARVDVDPAEIIDFDTREEYERVARRIEATDADTAGDPRDWTAASADAPSGARAVPEQVLRMRDLAAGELPGGERMTDAEIAAVLEFASRVKHSDSSLSPVVAAFLAGRLHAATREGGASLAEALAQVEGALTRSRG